MPTTTSLRKLSEIGIVYDRRILYSDIKVLDDCGYEILCGRSKNNKYHGPKV